MINAGIIGGAGCVAGELIRLLIYHPDVELKWVQDTRFAGDKISAIHQGLVGETEMCFSPDTDFDAIDVVFFCTPHGTVRKYMESHDIPGDLKIIDLSSDFIFGEDSGGFIYGLPELNRKYIVHGSRVSNPGSVAAAVELALLPLAKNLLLNSDINLVAVTGTTCQDKEADGNCPESGKGVCVYSPLAHPQMQEIREMLVRIQTSFNSEINMIPVRGGFARGILITAYMDCSVELDEIRKLYENYYSDHNFTFVTDTMPDLKDVANTNKCLLHLSKEGDKLVVTAAVDNMLKGSAGQAVHNMNLLFGLHERVGLNLKASVF